MLEYFAYKKVKLHRAEKEKEKEKREKSLRTPTPVLTDEDEAFLRRIAEEGQPPALPERPIMLNPEVGQEIETGDPMGTSVQTMSPRERGHEVEKQKRRESEEKEKEGSGNRISNRISALFGKSTKVTKEGLHSTGKVPPAEAEKEEDDIARVLNDLNLSAVNNRAFSMSKESNELVHKFTLVLKDIVNGAPHAYDDLVALLDDSQGTLAKSYESMPSSMQKLVTQLPEKLTSTLAPELLAVATEAQGMNKDGGKKAMAAGGDGMMGAAKSFLKPNSLKDLVTKPGAVAGALKTIMNTLKLRWPAFMGTNVLLSLGLFVLLFVFWYCHKRGKEVRLANGKIGVVDSEGRIVELPDDPQLEGAPAAQRRSIEGRRRSHDLGEDSSRDHRHGRHHHSGSSGSHRSKRSHRSNRRDDGHHERREEVYASQPQRQCTSERLDDLVYDENAARDVGRDDRDYDRHDRHERR